MGQLLSSAPWMATCKNEIGLTLDRTYRTKHPRITTIRVHPSGELFVAGNEEGTLLLFDLSSRADYPQHCCTLSFEYGGVSEICWLGSDFLAVGTTRGKIVTFSVKNDNRRLVEVMNTKAHGDGAAQIAVDGLDYCPTSHRLVSVAEGVGSVRLWNVSNTGSLAAQELPLVTTAYNTPRYVSFLRGGTQLLVAFMEKSMVQIFSVEPFGLALECFIGQEYGHEGRLGSALVVEAMERLLVLNWGHGFSMYDFQTVTAHNPASMPLIHHRGSNSLCNQGLASMRNGSYIASVLDRGDIQLWKAREGTSAGFLKFKGQDCGISAIHAASGIRDSLVAASIREDGGPSTLTVWRNENRPLPQQNNISENQIQSNIKIALLCIAVCAIYQFTASLVPWTGALSHLRLLLQPLSYFSENADPTFAMTTITVTSSIPITTITITPSMLTATITATPSIPTAITPDQFLVPSLTSRSLAILPLLSASS